MPLDERVHHLLARFPDVKVHLYGKAERPARKVGHVTALGTGWTRCGRGPCWPRGWLSTAEWADGWSPYEADARATRFPRRAVPVSDRWSA